MSKRYSIFTQSVMGGHNTPGEAVGPAVPPITASVGYLHPDMASVDAALGGPGGSADQPEGYVYARNGAPTQALFEKAVAALEEADAALAFSSGLAAIHAAILATVPPGGSIVAAKQLYGSTRSMLDWLGEAMKISVHYADFLDNEALNSAVKSHKPTAVYCELLTNPLARVIDLEAVASAAKKSDSRVLVDNTFATPFLIKALEWGADLVVHSATKFLNGHGDVLGGVLAGPNDLVKIARGYRKMLGANLGPFESWLALRGMRTFALRMRQACVNARMIAAALEAQPRVSAVYYPGLRGDPQHDLANKLFRRGNYGAMLAFEVDKLDKRDAFRFMEALEIVQPVTSLGDITTLISHPATASHRGLPDADLAAQGIKAGTLRLSIGIEEPNELIEDLVQALGKVS
jgi:cystathionine beta-lyase/cystathionine gamma-synthase